jgi:hypothetical protein
MADQSNRAELLDRRETPARDTGAAVRPWRDLAMFLCGPALVAVAISALFAVHPWVVPVKQQAVLMTPRSYGPMLALAALGVWLSSIAGLPSAPALGDWKQWRPLLGFAAALGLALGASSILLDVTLGLSRIAAGAIRAPSINVAFPASVAHYVFGAIFVESTYRLAPIPILLWLIGSLMLRGRHQLAVFWSLAVLTSLIEPVGQTVMLSRQAPLLVSIVAVTEFAGNLVWSELFRRYGWAAPVVVRLAQELTWHVAWPLVSGR